MDLLDQQFSRTELLHTTTTTTYVLLICNYLQVTNPMALLVVNTLAHYIVTITRTNTFGWTLLVLAVFSFASQCLRHRSPWKGRSARVQARSQSLEGSKYSEKSRKPENSRKPDKPENSRKPEKPGKPENSRSTEEPNTVIDQAPMIVDGFRFIVSSLVCISIFSCDFNIYPMHKLKSQYFGMSLMDFGVVSYMFNAGILCGIKHRFRAQKTLYMVVMGLIRLGVLQSGYHSDPTEYGVHLNFYFVYLITENFSLLFKQVHPLIASAFLFAAHEALVLKDGFIDYVFYAGRNTFISANREGLISIVPYAGVLFLGKYVGGIVFKKHLAIRQKGLYMLYLSFALFALHFICSLYLAPSRRLNTLSFSSFTTAAVLSPLGLMTLLSTAYPIPEINHLRGVGRYMGPQFLLSNVYVLIGNLLFDWRSLSTVPAHVVNLGYMAGLFVIPVVIKTRCLKS
ncbi:phosphatidylinositol glycan, class W [Nematocida displodere]|uniref:GPI-anchored wall transfer protein n=1 Tax=Nematocida displodere TaxID=1805483 RepID=A0A177EC11_9MICR|nr:phosphatidylinositol glycan, class W [Nematocida displodere]